MVVDYFLDFLPTFWYNYIKSKNETQRDKEIIMTLLTSLFLGFFALIVIFQVVPAVLMFVGMVKGFAKTKSEVVE